MGRALSPSGWHRPPIRTGYHAPARGKLHEGRLADRPGSLQVAFGRQERQGVITSCGLSVKCSESATVIRSTSVVLSGSSLSEGRSTTQTLGSLGHRAPESFVSLTIEGKRAGVAQSVERQPSKLNVAGSRPVSRSKSHFVLSTTLSLLGASRSMVVARLLQRFAARCYRIGVWPSPIRSGLTRLRVSDRSSF